MPNIKKIVVPATVSAGAVVALDVTPLLGGQGREGLLFGPAGGLGTGVVQLQGAPDVNGVAGTFVTLQTLTSATTFPVEIPDLPDYIRANVTTAPAAATELTLEGVQ
ncbi:hypothetical protein [Stenotrophomonas sp.]|uniref:hypothetical protein n=1 Tax=Stenotrophomonas sp. TaxID=69392 RepID=UPI002899B646|nr:hypothetical protein [Stenotrophomonas sp.]